MNHGLVARIRPLKKVRGAEQGSERNLPVSNAGRTLNAGARAEGKSQDRVLDQMPIVSSAVTQLDLRKQTSSLK